MGCAWIIEHRLRNPKWVRRREPCDRNGVLVPVKGGKASVELCARHSAIFREQSYPSRTANLFEIENRRWRRYILSEHLRMGGDIEGEYQNIVREVIADFPELFTAPSPEREKP